MKNKTQIFKSYEDFLNREYKGFNGVSEEFAKTHPNFEKDNETNRGCWNCLGCRDCVRCDCCEYCDGCTRCLKCVHKKDLAMWMFNMEEL